MGDYYLLTRDIGVTSGTITKLSTPHRMKLLLAKNSWKTEIKLFPLGAVSHEN